MEISNSNSLWAMSSLYSSSSTTSTTTSGSSAFTDLMSSVQSSSSSLAGEMASMGAESLGEAPDFASMSLEEFREHLCELQQALADSGVDISSLADPSTLSDEELTELQEEMSSRGKNPPPPPPMEMMNLNFVDYSDLSEAMYQSLFDYL